MGRFDCIIKTSNLLLQAMRLPFLNLAVLLRPFDLPAPKDYLERFVNTKGVIRSRKSKDRQMTERKGKIGQTTIYKRNCTEV